MPPRLIAAAALAVALAGSVVFVVRQGQLPPADFTFNNDSEIESLDPAVVTGQPEGRIIDAVFEGLVHLGPKNREPRPGTAERWELSDDGLTYTFYLREDAEWSDGSPVTAEDFVYSMRRFLDPMTLAEYSYQAWYLKNGRRYSLGARALAVGDPTEVELHERPEGALPYARGKVVRGELVAIEPDAGYTDAELADPATYVDRHTFVVETADGTRRHFRIGGPDDTFDADTDDAGAGGSAEVCRQVLLDFSEVGFRAIDAYTIETVLESPTPYWLELLGFYPLAPVNQECVETHGPRWTDPDKIVTNGAYRVAFRRLRDRTRLVKNPTYWDAENVALETIDALAVQSLTTSLNLYETGQCDYISKVSPIIAREFLAQDPPRPDFDPSPQFGTYYYTFNVTRKPLDDPRVRRALVMAIDRAEILATAGSVEVPARSFTPPGLPDYEAPEGPAENVEAAQALLAEAGYPGGRGFPKIEVLYNFEESHQTIAELVRKQWRRNLGIDVATRNEEWGAYLTSQRTLNYDVVRRAWIGDYLDPNTFLDLFLTGGGNNNTGWGDPAYDRLIRDAQREVDPERRLEMLREAEAMLMRDGPVLPLFFYASRGLVRPTIRGFYSNLQDFHPLRYFRYATDAELKQAATQVAAEEGG